MQSAYREDLAFIHDAGFRELAENAASAAVRALKNAGFTNGTVVDLGCGSGVTAGVLSEAGFDVFGVDLSEPMIEQARERVPAGRFVPGSFVTTEIPRCIAVMAIGEVFNYQFDPENNTDSRQKLFARIHAALEPGGLLLFDVAGPERAPSSSVEKTFVEAPDWVVMVEVEADDHKSELVRRITTFRRRGDSYRRNREVHRLELLDAYGLEKLLKHAGFEVQVLDQYGSLPLPRGLTGFAAHKGRA